MGKKPGRTVSQRPNGSWAITRDGAGRASSLHPTQKEAEREARGLLKTQGGGELITKGTDGKIRSKDTIAPARDPNPPKDKEH